MAFEQTIQQWISLDDQIKIYSSKIKELREKKNILENKATLLASENKLLNTNIKIHNWLIENGYANLYEGKHKTDWDL